MQVKESDVYSGDDGKICADFLPGKGISVGCILNRYTKMGKECPPLDSKSRASGAESPELT